LLVADVAVIGSGIAGSAAVLAATRKDAEVVLFTKLPNLRR
jgi:succinate dehydrogenase/fumarate reductase flavoprotein subunit